MCGRYTFTAAPEEVADHFGLPSIPTLTPRYNAAPGQVVAVVGLKPGGSARGLALLKWGFVPRWATSPNDGPKPINAKAETVAFKAPFKDSFRDRRCLIPADGFFEWKAEGKSKVPHHFRLKGGGLFAFAGVWDVWQGKGHDPIHTCAIITVPANELVKHFHERMPAILLPEHFGKWLDKGTTVNNALSLLKSLDTDRMEVAKVGNTVNKVAKDGLDCLTPAA